jgi:ring-1,2-phenylacetyl-CoA epoxidase subunit PaaC
MTNESLFHYTLHLADTALVMGHRLSEWIGHAPQLEIEMALANQGLDFIGQARSLYQYAAEVEGKARTEDDLAYLRDVWDFKNTLLTELPNGDFGATIARNLYYSLFMEAFFQQLQKSTDSQLAAIAEKSVKEMTYHARYSSEWTIRLGDGTEESRIRMQKGIEDMWPFTGEMFVPAAYEQALIQAGVAVDVAALHAAWKQRVQEVLDEATLEMPADCWMQEGGKTGRHSEHLGFLLAEMQFLQRAYPGATW